MRKLSDLFNSLESKTSSTPFGNSAASETVTAEMIHEEFYHACDYVTAPLTTEAKAALERSKRLKKIGFMGMPDLGNSEKVARATQIARLVNKYAVSHPLNKVISNEEVNRITVKYDLVLRPANRYKGNLPEKNLIEIENFKPTGLTAIVMSSPYYSGGSYVAAIVDGSDAEETTARFKANQETLESRDRSTITNEPIEQRLSICCPPTDVHLEPYERLENGKIVHVPDPIVLCPIESNCYLIVTAWGEEAKEVNEKLN